jgi:hypothetical protein
MLYTEMGIDVLSFCLKNLRVSKGEGEGTRRPRGSQGNFFASNEWRFLFSGYFLLREIVFLILF